MGRNCAAWVHKNTDIERPATFGEIDKLVQDSLEGNGNWRLYYASQMMKGGVIYFLPQVTRNMKAMHLGGRNPVSQTVLIFISFAQVMAELLEQFTLSQRGKRLLMETS